MPPPLLRPFPFPLHVGTDICHIPRIAAVLRRPVAAQFIRRVLAPIELDCAKPEVFQILQHVPDITRKPVLSGGGGSGRRRRQREPEVEAGASTGTGVDDQGSQGAPAELPPHVYSRAAQYLAGRFAAKEAVIKAHPHLSLSLHSIAILPASVLTKLRGPKVSPVSHRTPGGARAPVALLRFSRGGDDAEQIARVSISHDAQFATATCIGYEDDTTLPEAAEPGMTQPGTTPPETAEPETAEPETAEPETAEPETAEPEATVESTPGRPP